MPLAKFATFALAALLAFGACASEEDARVVRVTRNIGGRPGFQVHWDLWKATFEHQNPGWPPPTGFVLTLARIMQEIQAGNRDVEALLKMLDDWEAGRKGNK